ncbi:MAG TPA: hypothetical protein VKO18_11385 [Terriglobia bacterium]|nr:hypothetical protein [Candidatus Acidoferrum sp.]HMD85287.1 hypothetical protein [Terriglobia bacterium]
MERKDFLQMGCCALAFLGALPAKSFSAEERPCDEQLKFIQNFLSDLMESIDSQVDERTKIKILGECGRGCFRRFQFKQDIAAKGKGSVDKLIEAYHVNFEAWRDGDTVHIRYGAVNSYGCFCPAARYRPGKPHDIHCYCTRATHQAIWETALGRPVKVEILQTVRRGDPTCHFLVHLS